MESITLDYKNFKAGISTANGIEDGGYSPLYGGHNIQEERDDMLYPQHAVDYTEWGASLPTGAPALYIKSGLYGGGTGSVFGMLIDDTNVLYDHDSISDFDAEATVPTTNIDIAKIGDESGAYFQDDIYIAGGDDVMLVNLTATGQYSSYDDDWWSVTRGHGSLLSGKTNIVVIEDTMYVIVKNRIHIWDGTSSQEDALILPPDFYATAAIKHPNGRDLIVLGTVKDDPAESANAGFRAYYINTVDLEFTDEIQITGEVQGVWNVGGTLYVTSNEWLGIFTGTAIEPVYHLNLNLSDSPANDIRGSLIWTHHATVTDQGYLLIPDGNKLLAVGNIGGGTILWHPYDAYANMDVVHMAFNIGNKYVGIFGYTGARWTGTLVGTIIELDNHDGAAKWASNKIRFNQKVWIRKIVIDHETLAASDDFKLLHIKDSTGAEQELRQITYTKYGAVNETRIDVNIETDIFQPVIQWITGGVGIRKITIFYEDGE